MAKKRRNSNSDHRGRSESDDFMEGVVEVEKMAIGGVVAVGAMNMIGGMMGGNK
jgi:hypothetical protein